MSSRFVYLSKHLKGQLGPCVGDVTFLHKRRSVVARVGGMTFLNHSWDPPGVASVCL